MPPDHLLTDTPARRPNRVLMVVGIVTLTVGMAVLLIFFVGPILRWEAAQSWQTAQATITSSTIEVSKAKESTSYVASFEYAYDVDGRTWTGDQHGFFVFSGSKKSSEELVARYPVGTTTEIFYDPQNPSSAVMDRSLGPSVWFSLGPVFLAMTGLAIFYIGLRGRTTIDAQ